MKSNPYTPPSADLFGGPLTGSSTVPQGVINQLLRTKSWVQFHAVLLYIFMALIILVGVIQVWFGGVLTASQSGGNVSVAYTSGTLAGALVFPALLAILFYYPASRLWKYGRRIRDLALSRSSDDLEAALNEQRAIWTFAGRMILVVIVVGVGLAAIRAVASAAASAAARGASL